jgi:sugar lactone lactonase YvrE
MRSKIIFPLGVLVISTLIFASCKKNHIHFCDGDDTIVATTKVFATGLNNPRGLAFGPDGTLYVAEGGIGGTNTSTTCDQVIPPVGPYTGSVDGGSISRINAAGVVSTYVDKLPSSQTSPLQGSLISGVADVAFVGKTLYAIFSGAGCSHGVPSIPNAVIKVKPDRSWSIVANLSEFQMANPVANPEPDDFEPDGTWYSMINVNGNLYAVEPNHGELDRITTSGGISRVIDISASQGHIVPTAMAFYQGNFYVGNLSTFPAVPGISSVYKITPGGQISVYATGFNMVLGLAFDQLGGLYVLENTTNNPFPTPGTGDIVRIDPSGSKQVITSGLNLPTGMTFGPDGKLYVSNWGFGPPAIGGGEIVQISFKCDEIRGANKN